MNDYIKDIRRKVGHDMIIVVGCGVIVYKDGKVLLQRRRDNGMWAIHGGCMEIGETTEETARRELLEETGLVAGKLDLLGVFSGDADMMYTYPNGDKVCIVSVVYVCQDFSGKLVTETDETLDLRWFDIDDMPADINPPDKKATEAFIAWAKTTEMQRNFQKRNISMLRFGSFKEIMVYLLNEIPITDTVGIGNSQTLKNLGITKALIDRGNIVYDKELGTTPDEIKDLKRKSLLVDCYISGANAVSVDGRIVNIDHSGNRAAAITYGPEKVYIVVGKNKIAATRSEALERARNIAAPANAKRAGYNPPCVLEGHCVDCTSPERVCNIVSVIEGQHIKGRLTLLVADADAGF